MRCCRQTIGVNTCESEDVLEHPGLTFVDWRKDYIEHLTDCVDMDAIAANLTLGVDARVAQVQSTFTNC